MLASGVAQGEHELHVASALQGQEVGGPTLPLKKRGGRDRELVLIADESFPDRGVDHEGDVPALAGFFDCV